MDWIYRHAYEFALRSPSKKDADDVAAMFVGAAVAMHIVFGVCLLDWWAHTGVGTEFVVVVAIVCMAVSFYHYAFRKNGARVIADAKSQRKKTNHWVAALLVIEVCFMPLLMAPVLILLSKIAR